MYMGITWEKAVYFPRNVHGKYTCTFTWEIDGTKPSISREMYMAITPVHLHGNYMGKAV